MKRPRDSYRAEPEAGPRSPWLEAAVRAHDPTTFLMSLGATEFAVLLAELEARRAAGGDPHRSTPGVTASTSPGDDMVRYRRGARGGRVNSTRRQAP